MTIFFAGPIACDSSTEDAGETAPPAITIDSATWAAAPEWTLDSTTLLCPIAALRCPDEEILLAGIAPDGDIALGTRTGLVFVYRRGAMTPAQIVFQKGQGNRTGFGGSIEPSGDSAWWIHMPDAPSRALIDEAGAVLEVASAALQVGVRGSAARGPYFARLVVPGAERLGDTVDATVEIISPESRRYESMARRRMPASFVKGATGVPLEPFFTAAPLWGILSEQQIYYADPNRYEIEWIGPQGVERRLVVRAPARPVTAAELDELGARFISRMPQGDPRFLKAAQGDVDRRRRGAPSHHPSITDIRFASDGRFLVRREPSVDSDSVRWELFDAAARPMSWFVLDGLDRLLQWRGDSILVARSGPRGSNVVHWMRFRPSGPRAITRAAGHRRLGEISVSRSLPSRQDQDAGGRS